MKLLKVISAVAAAAVIMTTASGCSLFDTGAESALSTYDFSKMELVQLEEPYDGQPTATIETDLGEMKLVLYPEYCPKLVENFMALTKEGYYNNKNIFAIMNDVYFLAGSDDETGKTGSTTNGELVDNEFSVNLWPYRGAVMGFSETDGKSDSRFFVCDNYDITDEEFEQLRAYKDADGNQFYPDELLTSFKDVTCVASFAGIYPVFGQLIDGFETLDKILDVKADETTLVPSEKVMIKNITLGEYHSDGTWVKTAYEINKESVKDADVTTAAETTAAASTETSAE